MPSYSFKPRFVPFVKNGTKRQTIRSIRKYAPKVGQPLTLLTGSRFKPVRIVENKPTITAVHSIFILQNEDIYVVLDKALTKGEAQYFFDNPACFNCFAMKLTAYDKHILAWDDGFRPSTITPDTDILDIQTNQLKECWFDMRNWWIEVNSLPFAGHITKW